jgi:hypothetical protein
MKTGFKFFATSDPPITDTAKRRLTYQERHDYKALVARIERLVNRMETLGHNDMGLLREDLAGRFHDATDIMRTLARELEQDASWPREG